MGQSEVLMGGRPLRTTVVGSYPFPGWLEFASAHLDQFGKDDFEELIEDATRIAIADQVSAGLDVISDGEQTRFDFNLSFYGHIEGIEVERAAPRRFGPPAHDQRGKHAVLGQIRAPRGLGCVAELQRLRRLAPPGQAIKVSIPGPYTLSGRLLPNATYQDRWALTGALLPLIRTEIEALTAAGAPEITVDEPSMSCYAYREDPLRFVRVFNDTVEPAVGKVRLSTHLCFGNYKARAVGPRQYAPMFPAFLDFKVDEIHLEMASREFAELEIIGEIAKRTGLAVGIVDVKSYYIETAADIAARVRRCLQYAPPHRLAFAPDCGLSQTARWAARKKLAALVEGTAIVRKELGLG
jgi:5-methyltetrahydropteroyltriglutamate--homocysteine methyltransferase